MITTAEKEAAKQLPNQSFLYHCHQCQLQFLSHPNFCHMPKLLFLLCTLSGARSTAIVSATAGTPASKLFTAARRHSADSRWTTMCSTAAQKTTTTTCLLKGAISHHSATVLARILLHLFVSHYRAVDYHNSSSLHHHNDLYANNAHVAPKPKSSVTEGHL